MADNEQPGPHEESPAVPSAAAKQEKTAPQDTGARLLQVATAPRKDRSHWPQHEPMTWANFLDWLDLDNPADHRECGCYVGGLLVRGRRTREAVQARSVLTLDADQASPGFLDDVARVLPGVAVAVHTTWSHGVKGDRYRLLAPLSRDVDAEGYRRLAEAVRDALGQHWGDDKGCPEPERFMYRPSTQGGYVHRVWEGRPLDVDRWLVPELDAYSARAIDAELARLDECDVLGWDSPGWNSTTHAVACNLIEFANSEWCAYTHERAEADLMERAPTDPGFGPVQHAECWESALRSVGSKDRPEPDGKGDPADDFDVVVRSQSSWSRLDLTGYLDGTHQAPEPALLRRDDGVALLYPGLTHSIHGESESGKSMVMQHECVVQLAAGEAVAYIDFESDPASMVERLRLLGADMGAVAERFVYVQPDTDPHRTPAEREAFLAMLDRHRYSLVVVDGVSESMDVFGLDVKDPNASAIEWARKLPKFVADRTGAAVVQIDHVVKNAEARGRFAIGGQAKMSGITGAAYALDVAAPIGRGMRGELVLRVAKDRPGFVRGKAGLQGSDRTQEAARIVVDSTGGPIQFDVYGPAPVPTADDKLEVVKRRIADVLDELPADHPGLTTNALKVEAHSNNVLFPRALDALVAGQYVTRTQRGQSKYHRLDRPYVPEFGGEDP